MTVHVNIGEAKTRLSELVAAAVRGEDVILDKAGQPQVRLMPVHQIGDVERARTVDRRRAAFGMWTDKFDVVPDLDLSVFKVSDEEWEERYRRKFGDSD